MRRRNHAPAASATGTSGPRLKLLLVGLAATILMASCRDAGPPRYSDEQLRIVSLVPAVTHLLIEIGLQDAIVAVGDYDDLAPIGTPSLGRFIDLDLERLTTLAPTHVLAYTGQAGLSKRVTQMAEQRRFVLADFPYPGRVAEGLSLMEQVGETIGRETKTSALAEEMRYQLGRFARLTAGRDRPRSLMLFSLDPVRASGPHTINDELLSIAGGLNAVDDATVTAPIFDREALRVLAPDAIFLLMPGQAPLAGMNDPRLDPLRGLDLPAMENQRVFLLNDPAVLLPGPSMVTTSVSMAVALHSDLAEPIAQVFRETP